MPTAVRLLFLSALSGAVSWQAVAAPDANPQELDGRVIAGELGCGGCHAGMPEPLAARSRTPGLGAGGDPLAAEFVFAYLADPVRRRTDIGRTRMPDFSLHEGERVALALYLGSEVDPAGDLASAVARSPRADAEAGARVFASLGCAGCHEHPEASGRLVGPDLSREGARVRPEWLERYLAAPGAIRGYGHPGSPGARMPDFELDAQEAEGLRTFLLSQGAPGSWTPAELTPFQRERTERMLEARLACKGCHTISGDGGRIGTPLDGISDRLQPSFVLEVMADPARIVPGAGMPRQHLAQRDARRVASYLLQRDGSAPTGEYASLVEPGHPSVAVARAAATRATTEPAAGTPVEGGEGTEGAALYATHCASCHGSEGRGDGFNAPSLPVPPTAHASAELMSLRPDDTLFDGIYAGAYVLDGSARMPGFGSLLTRDEIRELVKHIRGLCGCEGPAWSRAAGTP